MRAVVTGAYGHIGANLVRALVHAGHEVTAADVRQTGALADMPVTHAHADVLDPRSLRSAFEGADVVFHLAAVISIVGDPTGAVWRVNVEGPRNAAGAALECGVRRFVHCSSVHAFDLEKCGPTLDERGPRAIEDHAPIYDRSKYAGECQVRAVIDEGLDAVIGNPVGVIGPHDYAPSQMGKLLMQLRDGKLPATIGGGFDFADARDVANGLIGTWERGATGENYLLSGTRVSIKEIAQLVAEVTGAHAPRLDIPLGLVSALAPLMLRITPRDGNPLFTPDSVHALRYSPDVSHEKAARELGYHSRPLDETIADTLDWFAGSKALVG